MIEKRILLLISYNKSFQSKLEKSLINYRIVSRKYIVYETPNKGIIYDAYDNIIYEGEFLNRKINGKGEEYYKNGRLKFEGEYLNGKINGKRKEYNYFFGELSFEGEYLNGKSNGKGKEYYDDGKLHYECEYLNGKTLYFIEYNKNKEIINEFRKGNGYLKT